MKNHIHKIKCFRCKREYDSIDRVKYFGKPSALLQHVCIQCREEIKEETRAERASAFSLKANERNLLDKKPPKAYTDKRASALLRATNIAQEKREQAAIDDFIGL